MKKQLKSIFTILGVSTLVFAGCRKREHAVQPTEPDYTPEDADNYTPEDTDISDVDKIDNVPCSDYSTATRQKIANACYAVYNSEDEEVVERVTGYLLDANFGEQLAAYSADWMIEFYSFRANFSNIYDGGVTSNKGESFKHVMSGALTILNSADISKVADAMRSISADYYETKPTLLEWRNPSIYQVDEYYNSGSTFNYYDYSKRIKPLYDACNENSVSNSDLDALVERCEDYFGSYHMLPETEAHYEREMNQLYNLFPNFVISFIKKNATKIQNLLVSNIKILADGLIEIANNFYKDFVSDYSVDVHASDYSFRNSYLQSLIKAFENKGKICEVLKKVSDSDELCNFLLDASIEVGVPYLELYYGSNSQNTQKINSIKTKLQGLSHSHLQAFANFVLKLLEKMSAEDAAALVNYFCNYNNEFYDQLGAFTSRNATILKQVIAETSGTDKNLIVQLSSIVGVDLIGTLSELADAMAGKSEYDANTVNDIVMGMLDDLMDSISFIRNNDYIDGYKYVRYVPDEDNTAHCSSIEIDYNAPMIKAGNEITANNITIHMWAYCGDSGSVSVSSTVGGFADTVNSMKEYYSSNPDLYAVLNSVSFEDADVDFDNQGIGENKFDLSVTFNYLGESTRTDLTLCSYVIDTYEDAYYVEQSYMSSGLSSQIGTFMNMAGLYLGSDEELGWHITSTDTYRPGEKKITISYTTSSGRLVNITKAHTIEGIIATSDLNSFVRQPEVRYEYTIDGIVFMSDWVSVEIAPSDLQDKSVGAHTWSNSDFEFTYYVVSTETAVDKYVCFNFDSVFTGSDMNLSSLVVPARVEYYYEYTNIYGLKSCICVGSEELLTIANVRYSNNKLTFEYDGITHEYRVRSYQY